MKIYGIKLVDEINGKNYLLLNEDNESYVTFDTEVEAGEFNDNFALTLDERVTSEIVELSE